MYLAQAALCSWPVVLIEFTPFEITCLAITVFCYIFGGAYVYVTETPDPFPTCSATMKFGMLLS